MKDKQGREYAKANALKAGDMVEIDGDFTCMQQGKYEVHVNDHGPYLRCSEGQHYLQGQLVDDYYLGIYPVKP